MIESASRLNAIGFGFILLLLLSDPAASQIVRAAPGSSPGDVINLQVESLVSLNVLSDAGDWNLDIGSNEKNITLQVKASGSWQVQADDASSLGGRMTKYSSSEGYDPSVQLADTLKLSSDYQPDSTPVDLATGGIIAAGSATGSSILDVPVILEQQVAWSDKPLDQNHNYRILIAFTAGLT